MNFFALLEPVIQLIIIQNFVSLVKPKLRHLVIIKVGGLEL